MSGSTTTVVANPNAGTGANSTAFIAAGYIADLASVFAGMYAANHWAEDRGVKVNPLWWIGIGVVGIAGIAVLAEFQSNSVAGLTAYAKAHGG